MTIEPRIALILNASKRPHHHREGVTESAKIMRDWIWVVTGQMLTVDQSEEIAEDMHRAYLAEQL